MEDGVSFFALGDADAVLFLDGRGDLERIERIETQSPFSEERGLGVQFAWRSVQIELFHEENLDFFNERRIHEQEVS